MFNKMRSDQILITIVRKIGNQNWRIHRKVVPMSQKEYVWGDKKFMLETDSWILHPINFGTGLRPEIIFNYDDSAHITFNKREDYGIPSDVIKAVTSESVIKTFSKIGLETNWQRIMMFMGIGMIVLCCVVVVLVLPYIAPGIFGSAAATSKIPTPPSTNRGVILQLIERVIS